jgi:hemin uptake protein HemP
MQALCVCNIFVMKTEMSLTPILITNRMRAILVCIHVQMTQSNTPAPDQPTTAPTSAPRPRVDSKALLQGATAVEIDHAGQRYLLRVTRENKLILTK